MDNLTLVIADDHPIFLDGLCRLIEFRHPGMRILASAVNGLEAVERTLELRPDVLLLDIRMPEMNGIKATEILKRKMPDLKIVMLTTFNEQSLLEEAMKAGVDGFMLKESSVDEVVEGIRMVMRGNILLPSKTARGIDPESLLDHQDDVDTGAQYSDGQISDIVDDTYSNAGNFTDVPVLAEMTEREREVFKLIVRNFSNEMIARKLFISERTVRNYVSKIYEMTGKHNRSSLIIWAMKKGLIG